MCGRQRLRQRRRRGCVARRLRVELAVVGCGARANPAVRSTRGASTPPVHVAAAAAAAAHLPAPQRRPLRASRSCSAGRAAPLSGPSRGSWARARGQAPLAPAAPRPGGREAGASRCFRGECAFEPGRGSSEAAEALGRLRPGGRARLLRFVRRRTANVAPDWSQGRACVRVGRVCAGVGRFCVREGRGCVTDGIVIVVQRRTRSLLLLLHYYYYTTTPILPLYDFS